jgi:hypothetical protein
MNILENFEARLDATENPVLWGALSRQFALAVKDQSRYIELASIAGDRLLITGVENTTDFYGWFLTGDFPTRAMLRLPKKEWREVLSD